MVSHTIWDSSTFRELNKLDTRVGLDGLSADDEISRILHEEEARAEELITKYRAGLELIAEALLEHETISGDEVYRLLNLSGANITPVKDTSFTTDAVTASDFTEAPVDSVVESDEAAVADVDEPANSSAD